MQYRRVLYQTNDHTDLSSLAYKLGFTASPNLAVEARLGTGLTDDSINGTTYEIDNYVGVYTKLILPMNPQFAAYAIGGYSRVEGKTYTRTSPGNNWTEHALSRGLGLDLHLAPTPGARMASTHLAAGAHRIRF